MSFLPNLVITLLAEHLLRFPLEWLRHTGASIAYRATKDMKAVANRLGHTSVRMLDSTYVKVYADAAREVADAIDRPDSRPSRGLSADS